MIEEEFKSCQRLILYFDSALWSYKRTAENGVIKNNQTKKIKIHKNSFVQKNKRLCLVDITIT